MTTLYECSEGPLIDIIAVHGLNAHPLREWVRGDVLWLKDVLPTDLPRSRILTFGYNANVIEAASRARLVDHASDLLQWTLDVRKKLKPSERPIIWICHSLGGLVVKQALVTANQDPSCRSVLTSTYGVLFLGTPHQGSTAADIGHVLARVARVCFQKPSTQMLEILKKDSLTLLDLAREFTFILPNLQVVSFYETKETLVSHRMIRGLKVNLMIVDETSSKLRVPGEILVPMDCDHSQICKFSGRNDILYQKVRNRILEFFEKAISTADKNDRRTNTKTTIGSENRAAVYEVPFSASPTFTGRKQILLQISNFYSSNGSRSQRRLAIYGLGGAGKTQIALTYARKHFEDHRASVFWINARSNETVVTDFTRFCGIFQLAANTDDEMVEAFKGYLATRSKEEKEWLLIFDNADYLDKINLIRYFPRCQNGNILITSRDRNAEDQIVGHGIEITEMDIEDAKAFLVARASLGEVSKADSATIVEIVTDLGCFPLMLEQAAAFIRATGVTLNTYLSYVKNKRADIFKYNRQFTVGLAEYQRSVETTWTISFEQVQIKCSEAAQLLLSMSYLDHSLIWEELFRFACKRYFATGLEEIPLGFPAYMVRLFSDDGYAFDIAMEALLTFSLVRRKQGKITIHPLVGHCARQWADSAERYIKETIRLVVEAFNDANERTAQDVEWWKLVPQIHHCCRMSKRLKGDCSDIGTPFAKMCVEATSLGGNRAILLESAEPFLDRVGEPGLAVEHAQCLCALYTDTFRHERAILLLEDTRTWVKELKSDDPALNAHLGGCTIQLADVYAVSGRLDKADEVMQSWKPLNPENPSSAEEGNLGYRDRLWGRHLYMQGDFAKAEKVLVPVLDREKPGNVNRAWVVTHLADVLCAVKRFDEIVILIEAELEVLDKDPGVFGHGPHNARLKVNLAEALIELQRYADASAVLSRLESDLLPLKDNGDAWVQRETFYMLSGYARISHAKREWKTAVEKWQAARDCATESGWGLGSRRMNLVCVSLDDARWELDETLGDAWSRAVLVQKFDSIKRHQSGQTPEEPMFYHWEGILLQKLQERLDFEPLSLRLK